MADTALQGASLLIRSCSLFTHTHSPTDGTACGSSLGFSVLPKDTLTYGLEEMGFELLYHLSHSRLKVVPYSKTLENS